MDELAPIDVAAHLLDEEAVACHVGILGVPVAGRLLDHQVRVAVAEDVVNADFFGQLEPEDELFILGYIVGGDEVDL